MPIFIKCTSFNKLDFISEKARLLQKQPANIILILLVSVILFQTSPSLAQVPDDATILTLDKAINLAHSNDEWLEQSKLREQHLNLLSQGATALPDPTLSLSLLNMPLDSFAFDQEAMTQLKIGASQMLPRGDTQYLTKQKYQIIAAEQPFQRVNRFNKISLLTTLLWLDAFQGAASVRLVNEAKPLFDKLNDIVTAKYTSSLGQTNQQDIIRAQLELSRLNDRLVSLQTGQQVALAALMQYLATVNIPLLLPTTLNTPTENELNLLAHMSTLSPKALYEQLSMHPLITSIEQRILAAGMDIELAEQAYKPQYSINASYAYRDDVPNLTGTINHSSRTDFFSIGVNVSLPLFSSIAQDAQVGSSIKIREAMRIEKTLLLRNVMAEVNRAYQTYLGASQRYDIYEQQLLPRLKQQVDTALAAYTNDNGDFSEVIRAKIALLDANINFVELIVTKRKSLATLAYYLSHSASRNTVLHTPSVRSTPSSFSHRSDTHYE